MKKLSEIKQQSTQKNEVVTKCETIKGGGCSCGDKRPGGNAFGNNQNNNNQNNNQNGWNGGW